MNELSEFTNSGTVKGTGNYVGGIFGEIYVNSKLCITDFSNMGAIHGNAEAEFVGAIMGYGYARIPDGSYMMDCKTTFGTIAGKLENVSVK